MQGGCESVSGKDGGVPKFMFRENIRNIGNQFRRLSGKLRKFKKIRTEKKKKMMKHIFLKNKIHRGK